MSETSPNIWEKLRTYLIVTVVSVLIWLYAEDENARVFTNEPATVRFVAPEGRELLIEPTAPQAVRLSVRCTQGQYARLKRLLEAGPIDLLVRDDPESDSPVRQAVLKELIATDKRVAELGVSVTEVQPATLPVRVERLTSVDLPVTVSTGELTLTGPATVEPIHASLKVPLSAAAGLDDQKLEVRLREVPNLAALAENVAHTADLAIHPPESVRAVSRGIDPPRAKVAFTIRSQTDRVTLTTVPVLLQVPPAAMSNFRVDIDEQHQFLRDVELLGPSDTIAAIRRNELRVNAILPLTSDDLDGAIKSKLPVIDKPAGVTVLSTVLPVNITITRVSAGSPTP